MRNRVLKSAWLLAVCLPTLALSQQPRGPGTLEFTVGGGVKVQDAVLQDYLALGSPTTRFTNGPTTASIAPGISARMGYNFTRNLGFSIGGEASSASGVTVLTPLATLIVTSNLARRTSAFMNVGSHVTRIAGQNERRMHSTWGADIGFGGRRVVTPSMALRAEIGIAFEHYAELPAAKTAHPAFAMIGLSYFTRRRRSDVAAP